MARFFTNDTCTAHCIRRYATLMNALVYTDIFDPTLGSMGKWLFVAALILAMKAETMGHRACIISNRNMRLPVHVAYDTPVRSTVRGMV
eukprot:scaffold4890_cov57-Attheya_sp.AAC.4